MRQEKRLRTMELSDKWQKKWNEHTVECHSHSPPFSLYHSGEMIFLFGNQVKCTQARQKKSQIVYLWLNECWVDFDTLLNVRFLFRSIPHMWFWSCVLICQRSLTHTHTPMLSLPLSPVLAFRQAKLKHRLFVWFRQNQWQCFVIPVTFVTHRIYNAI